MHTNNFLDISVVISILCCKHLQYRQIVYWKHSFIVVFMSSDHQIHIVLVQKLFQTPSMNVWYPNSDLNTSNSKFNVNFRELKSSNCGCYLVLVQCRNKCRNNLCFSKDVTLECVRGCPQRSDNTERSYNKNAYQHCVAPA